MIFQEIIQERKQTLAQRYLSKAMTEDNGGEVRNLLDKIYKLHGDVKVIISWC